MKWEELCTGGNCMALVSYVGEEKYWQITAASDPDLPEQGKPAVIALMEDGPDGTDILCSWIIPSYIGPVTEGDLRDKALDFGVVW